MAKPNLKSILFNAAGVGVVLIVGGYMVKSLFTWEETPRCSQRYASGQQFALQNSKRAALSPIELQARVATREWGLLDNARVVEATDKSAMYLQVAMTAGDGEADAEDEKVLKQRTNGVGFVWQPQNISGARAACLTYRVFMPKGFSFAGPGALPGLFATSELSQLDDAQPKTGFVSRLGWQKEGGLGIDFRTPLSTGLWLSAKNTRWPTNRWVTVEEEVVLNAKDKANGQVRLWVDGELKIENTALNLGSNEHTSISGVVADIGYNKDKSQTGQLTISQFLVQKQ